MSESFSDKMRALHVKVTEGYCEECGAVGWPCDVALLIQEHDEEVADLKSLVDTLVGLDDRHRGQRDLLWRALEQIVQGGPLWWSGTRALSASDLAALAIAEALEGAQEK